MPQLQNIFILLMVTLGSANNANSGILSSTTKSLVSPALVPQTQVKSLTTQILSHTRVLSSSSTIKPTSTSSTHPRKQRNKSVATTNSSSTKTTSHTQPKSLSSSSSSSRATHLSSSSILKSKSSTVGASTHSSSSSKSSQTSTSRSRSQSSISSTKISSSSSSSPSSSSSSSSWSSITKVSASPTSSLTSTKTTSSASFSTPSSSSAQPSVFTSITATNVTSVSSCYQLPTPTASLLGVETDIPQSDGSFLSLLFYYSADGSTVNYIGGGTNYTFLLFDLSVSDQLGIWMDGDPYLLATPNGLTIFGPNCTWETSFDIPNFYTQLTSIFSLTAPQPTKRNDIDDLIERQSPPQFEVYLTLDPDCGTTTFQTYSASDVALFVNQNIPCQQYEANTNEFSFACQQPGATLTQAKCENGAANALNTVKSNHWWQFITSTAHKISDVTTFIDRFETAAYLVGLKWVASIQAAIPYRTPLDIANDIDTVGTAVNALTPNQVASVCALNPYTGAGSVPYSLWLQIGSTMGAYPQLLGAPFQVTASQYYTVDALVWVTPGLEDISVRCAVVNDGNWSPGLLCNNARPCNDVSVCSPGQLCMTSECCSYIGNSFQQFCVNPTTCNSD